jgi:hypothetical protein
LSACTTIKEVVKEGETKIEYRDRARVDSVLSTFKDSVFINGDTVKIYRDRWRNSVKINTDTVYKSIDKIIEKEKVVQLKPTFLQKIKFFAWGTLAGVIVCFCMVVYLKK